MDFPPDTAAIARYNTRGMTSPEEIMKAHNAGITPWQVGDYYSAGIVDVDEMIYFDSLGAHGSLIRLFDRLQFPRERLHDVAQVADGQLVQFLLDRGARGLDDIVHAVKLGVGSAVARIFFSCGMVHFDEFIRVKKTGMNPKVVSSSVQTRGWLWEGPNPSPEMTRVEMPAIRVRSNGSLVPLALVDGFQLSGTDPDDYLSHRSADVLGGDGRLTRVETCWRQALGSRWSNRGDLPKGLAEWVGPARRALIASAWLGTDSPWDGYAIDIERDPAA